MLLLHGGDTVPAPAGDQRHAACGSGLPEGHGPDDREGERGRLRVRVRVYECVSRSPSQPWNLSRKDLASGVQASILGPLSSLLVFLGLEVRVEEWGGLERPVVLYKDK